MAKKEEALHVGRPNIGDRGAFLSRVNDILDRRWMSNDGPADQVSEEVLGAEIAAKGLPFFEAMVRTCASHSSEPMS